jgi:hypothetical protein
MVLKKNTAESKRMKYGIPALHSEQKGGYKSRK